MAQVAPGQYVFDFSGGRLCLDFVNTIGGPRTRPTERLTSYQDLIAWGRQGGVLREADARHLTRVAAERPRPAAAALAEAIALREALYRIFSSLIEGVSVSETDLEALNAALSRALRHLRVVPRGRGYEWSWAPGEEALDQMLWPVVRSAGELLVSHDVVNVRRCASEDCDWLFMDTSRNHSRRWCDMRSCGNRAKVRRYYARKRASG